MNDFLNTRFLKKTGATVATAIVVFVSGGMFFATPIPVEALNAPSRGMGTGSPRTEAAEVSAATAEAQASNGGGDEIDCNGFNSVLCTGLNVVLQPFIAIMYVVFFLANGILWVSAQFLNGVLLVTVLQFGQNFGNSEGLLTAWGVLRDLGNVFLLFSFVFMGLSTILNLHDYTVKKTLPKLIIFAVLLNFSLFVAEAVIDVANGVSVAIVAQSSAGLACDTTNMPAGGNATSYCARHYGVTGLVMQFSGGSTLLGTAPQWEIEGLVNVNYSLRMAMVMAALTLFTTILTVVFFAAGIMLTIRVVVLLIIMVTSPIGFAGMVVPFLSGLAKQWWEALIKQSLFVPIFLLIVFIGFKVVDSSVVADALNNGTLSEALINGDVSATDIFVVFSLTIGFMIGALMIAQKLGAAGAGFAIKTAGGATYGTLAWVGRRTLGQGAMNLASVARRQSWLMRSPIGRPLAGLLDKGANSSFDFRASGAAKFATGKAGIDAGATSGAAAKGISGIIEDEKSKKIHHFEGIEEEEDRLREGRIEQYNRARDELAKEKNKPTPNTARLASLRSKVQTTKKVVESTAEGRRELREEEAKEYEQEVGKFEAQVAQAKQKVENLRAQARSSTNATQRRIHSAAADAAERDYVAQSDLLATQKTNLQGMQEAVHALEEKVREEKLTYARQLGRSGDWSPVPFVGYRADREAAVEMRRLLGRTKDEKQFEKLLGAVKSVGGGGSHGGGGGHPPAAHAQANVLEHAAKGEIHS